MARPGTVLRTLVRTVGEVLITAGVLILLFLVWQLWWTDVVGEREQAATVVALEQTFARTAAGPTPDGTPAPIPGDAFAIIHIPRFGADYARPILEDTGPEILARGVGHYTGSVLPGEVGNFAIAGHRTTYGKPFNLIATLEAGDEVVIETATAYSIYAVDRHQIVRPWETRVIAPVPDEPDVAPTEAWLTMTSCHPMFSARERYIVHSRLVETVLRESGRVPDRVSEILGGR